MVILGRECVHPSRTAAWNGSEGHAIVRLRPDGFLNDRPRSTTDQMNRTHALVSALAAGILTAAGMAQTTGPQVPSTSAAASAAVAPQAIPAKIALIEYEQVAAASNEGQRALQELQKKYEPKKAALDSLGGEIDSLTKQLQAAPATMPEDERASRQRDIETKQKQLQRDGDDATAAYNADVQDALAKVAKKLGPTVIKYVQDHGFTMLLDNTGQQGGLNVLWAPGTDISQAVVEAYNAASGVAAPVPSAPSANRTRTTTPRSSATKP
jgi:Skp family chaperone for outer membrane proteins